MAIPSRIVTRLTAGLKKFQPILVSAKSRDINESDTVVIITDMLQDIFGYDKYTEITSEHAIKGTFVDLAIKLDNATVLLIEVKAIGSEMKDSYVKQAIDYGANLGVDWVVLSTGVHWRVYKIIFSKPISCEIVFEFNILELNPKDEDHLECLWMLSKESWQKESLKEFHAQKQALNRYLMAALLQSDPILDVIRRELKRVTPGVRIDSGEILKVLTLEVIKRDALEGEKADASKKLVMKAAKTVLRTRGSGETKALGKQDSGEVDVESEGDGVSTAVQMDQS
jgi:hypothetical protein